MAIKYTIWPEFKQNGHTNTNIFHCKTFRNLPKLGFLFEKIPSGNTDLHGQMGQVRGAIDFLCAKISRHATLDEASRRTFVSEVEHSRLVVSRQIVLRRIDFENELLLPKGFSETGDKLSALI
jgi:hypothetical protein